MMNKVLPHKSEVRGTQSDAEGTLGWATTSA